MSSSSYPHESFLPENSTIPPRSWAGRASLVVFGREEHGGDLGVVDLRVEDVVVLGGDDAVCGCGRRIGIERVEGVRVLDVETPPPRYWMLATVALTATSFAMKLSV
ncbi:MAG TPA: hypothetical protein VGL35_04840 [Rhizomicrobium sp.]|jgi:hypothetical protein